MAITKVTREILSTGIDDNSNATAITIDSSERVGIGTTSPSTLLHLNGTTNHTYLTVEANSGVTAASKYISGSNAYRVGIDTTSGGGDADFVIANTESGGDTRLIIQGTTGTLHNESNVAGVGRFGGWSGNALSMADDASITLGGAACGAWHVHVYERGSGAGAVYWCDYDGTTKLLEQEPAGGAGFANSDSDGHYCLYKSDNAHTVTFKNRNGSTRSLLITIFGAEA